MIKGVRMYTSVDDIPPEIRHSVPRQQYNAFINLFNKAWDTLAPVKNQNMRRMIAHMAALRVVQG